MLQTHINAIKNRTISAEVKTAVKGRPVSGYVAETDEIVQYTISERENSYSSRRRTKHMVGSVTRDVIPAAAATLVTSSSSSSRDLNVGGVVVDSTSETLRRFSTDVISTSRRVTHKHIIRHHLIIRNAEASLVQIESRDRHYQGHALHISLGSQDRKKAESGGWGSCGMGSNPIPTSYGGLGVR